MVTTADNGRVYIPKDLREKFGEKFHIVEREDGIVLVPVSDDPLEALRDEFSDVEKSVEELKEGAMETAVEEAGK
jgi:AbrB family looped-hinge helix DNA binding protein